MCIICQVGYAICCMFLFIVWIWAYYMLCLNDNKEWAGEKINLRQDHGQAEFAVIFISKKYVGGYKMCDII